MMNLPPASLRREARQYIGDGHRVTHADFSKEPGVDRGIDRPDPELMESLGLEIVFAKEAVAQITGGIYIGGIIDMTIGVDVRPPDFISPGIFVHVPYFVT